MDWMDLEKDHDYFKKLWEYHRPGGMKHTAEVWNDRARDWKKDLETDTLFRRQTDERVDSTAKFLRKRGLLQAGSTVVDIGCGPGRFVVEFAKTAGHATGIDISSEMLNMGKLHGESKGVSNVSFIECDFKNADIEELGWTKQFDLVFSSMSPSMGDVSGLNKIINMSRGWCFNCSPIYGEDLLENQIAEDIFGDVKNPRPLWDQRWFYSLFNLLWLDGYLPETFYHNQEAREEVEVNEILSGYYASLFTKRYPKKEDLDKIIYDYLMEKADSAGKICQESKRVYGWLLWDVRKNMNGSI